MNGEDRALLEAINAITQMVPNIQTTIGNIATLNEKMANVESNTKKQFDMLLAMQRDELTMRKYELQSRRNNLKMWLAMAGALITMVGNVLLAVYKK